MNATPLSNNHRLGLFIAVMYWKSTFLIVSYCCFNRSIIDHSLAISDIALKNSISLFWRSCFQYTFFFSSGNSVSITKVSHFPFYAAFPNDVISLIADNQ